MVIVNIGIGLMKEALVRFRDLKGMLVGIEMDLKLLKSDLIAFNNDIFLLKELKNELEYNIDFLKKPKIISKITEYKKSVDQLEKVNKKLIKVTRSKKDVMDKILKKHESYEYYHEEYRKVYLDIEKDPVILVFKKESSGE